MKKSVMHALQQWAAVILEKSCRWTARCRILVLSVWVFAAPWVAVITARAQKPAVQSHAPNYTYGYQTVAAAAPTLPAEASPNSVAAGTPSQVTILARVPQSKALSQVVLFRLLNGTKRQIGHLDVLKSDSRSAIYSTQIILNERNMGTVLLQVEAQYSTADHGTYDAAPADRGLDSNLLSVNVTLGQGGQALPPSGHSGGGGGGFWGSFGGAAAGAVAGGLLEHFLERHPKAQAPQLPALPPSTVTQPPIEQASQKQPEEPAHHSPPPSNDTPLQSKGLSIRYPAGWKLSQEILQLGGPIALRTFGTHTQGDVIPSGGATIDITNVPGGTQALEDTAQAELGSGGMPQFVDGKAALRVYYMDEFTPDLVYENIAVYVADGTQLYKFFLSFRAGDPGKEKFVGNFDHILASAHFVN